MSLWVDEGLRVVYSSLYRTKEVCRGRTSVNFLTESCGTIFQDRRRDCTDNSSNQQINSTRRNTFQKVWVLLFFRVTHLKSVCFDRIQSLAPSTGDITTGCKECDCSIERSGTYLDVPFTTWRINKKEGVSVIVDYKPSNDVISIPILRVTWLFQKSQQKLWLNSSYGGSVPVDTS